MSRESLRDCFLSSFLAWREKTAISFLRGGMVKTVINRVEGVVESSVVGIPDERWREKVVAAVVKKPDSRVNPEQIQGFCKQHLHNWKCPKEIVFLKELPKNRMGKVLKEEVKRCFSGLNTKNP
jgi:fatty-acyl-CoA synthase